MRATAGRGFTLIEVGLVVGLLGLLVLFMADFYSQQLKLKTDDHRIDGIVQDVWSIIDASRAWAARNAGDWPNDGNTLTPRISIRFLVRLGYLREVPRTRYPGDCGDGCDGYTLTGWNRSTRTLTSTVSLADDLLIRFSVPGGVGGRRADIIAARIPLGYAERVQGEEFMVEARIIRGGSTAGGLDYVRLLNEDRTIEFEDGDLQGVRRIARERQDGGRADIDGTGIGLDTDRLSMGVFGSSSDPRSQLVLNTDSSTVSNTEAVMSIGDKSGNTHTLTLGMADTTLNPYMELLAYKNGTDTPLKIEFLEASSEDTDTHPAHWDMYLTDQPAHRSLQTRLCSLEETVDDIDLDVTCPVDTTN